MPLHDIARTSSVVVSAQVSIARRLVKEVAHYEAETKKDEARVEAMRADPTKDEYDVKKMLEVVEESRGRGVEESRS